MSVRDKDRFKTQFLGEVRLPVAWLGEVRELDAWFKLEARVDKPDKNAQGELHVRLRFDGKEASEEERAAAAKSLTKKASLFGSLKNKVTGGPSASAEEAIVRVLFDDFRSCFFQNFLLEINLFVCLFIFVCFFTK